LGLLLLADVVPIYITVEPSLAVRASLVLAGVIAAYCGIQFLVSRRLIGVHASLGAVLAIALLIGLYLAGAPGGVILGGGEGELAAVTFLGLSLVVAAVRADPGCEVMALPGALFRRHTELACLVFSPLDRLERKLRAKRAV
jgi:hypothetical protein